MNKKSKWSLIIFGIGVIAILVGVLLLSRRATKVISEYKIKNEEVYMFFEDERFDYNTELTLNRENNVTNLKFDGQEVELFNEPIFLKNSDEVILPTDMGIVFPLEGVGQKKASYFSKLTLNKGKVYLMEGDSPSFDLSQTFLYDGEDLYFFCDDVTITIDDEEIKIPAFSYVLCQYNGNVYIFDYSKKEVTIYNNETNNVKATDGSYVVNLCYDSVQFNDKAILLIKNVKNLKKLK